MKTEVSFTSYKLLTLSAETSKLCGGLVNVNVRIDIRPLDLEICRDELCVSIVDSPTVPHHRSAVEQIGNYFLRPLFGTLTASIVGLDVSF